MILFARPQSEPRQHRRLGASVILLRVGQADVAWGQPHGDAVLKHTDAAPERECDSRSFARIIVARSGADPTLRIALPVILTELPVSNCKGS
ncbi:hypothetical protein [Acetobacter nitrogenifigens]|uniref:hypothetical protein n=1 Tax=Acetobacter nitrogenifigens TaxID=285268 RepID=UPI00047ADF7C|nr:hypothetical protein [Acetobacter nitrogenifigens]